MKRPSAVGLGLPQMSSALRPKRKRSPGRRRLDSTARHTAGGPGITAMLGVSGIGVNWPTAQTSATTLNSNPPSTKVCICIPGEPPERSPKTMVMVSPSLR